MLCYRCGSHVPDGSETCSSCGQRFDNAARGSRVAKERRKPGDPEGTGIKIGEVLANRYEVRAVVGQGPVGVVLRALDREVDVEIGLKLISPRLLQSPDERAEFMRLLRQAKRLSHPNIVRIYEIGMLETEGTLPRPFFTMQLLDGLTLRRVIDLRREKDQIFGLREVEPILAQIALGLEHGAAFGPHGDLKPDNVIVLPDLLKVTDFGLEPAMPRVPFVAAQRTRKADGYLAPEVLAGRPVDGRADVFSLGVILGEMAGGIAPGSEQPTLLREANPDLPPAIEALYRRAISQTPEGRFPSAGDFAAELLEIAETTAPPLPHVAPPKAPKRGAAMPAVPPPFHPRPPPPPEASGEFAVAGYVTEEVTDPTAAPLADLPPEPPPESPPPPPARPLSGEDVTRAARAPRLPPAEPEPAVEAAKLDAQRMPRERAGKSPATRTGLPWMAIAPLLAIAAAGAGYGGYVALLDWKDREKAQLEAQMAREKAQIEAQIRQDLQKQLLASQGDAGVAAVDGGVAATVADAGPASPVAETASPEGPPAQVKKVMTAKTAEKVGVESKVRQVDLARAGGSVAVTRASAGEEKRPEAADSRCPPDMRFVRGGTFRLGTAPNDDLGNFGDRAEKRVSLHGYCIDQYEYPDRQGEPPMVGVSWNGAEGACAAQGKRLCSEEEWEKACKGPANLRFPYGEAFQGGVCNGPGRAIRPVGGSPGCKSGYGIFDLSGNVAEWTSTKFQVGATDRTVKGGSFASSDTDLRCSARANRPPESKSGKVGFRCCADLH